MKIIKFEQSIYDLQSNKQIENVDIVNLNSKELKIFGLYDPADYDLKIDMVKFKW